MAELLGRGPQGSIGVVGDLSRLDGASQLAAGSIAKPLGQEAVQAHASPGLGHGHSTKQEHRPLTKT